ncbi:replication endonuclease [Pseudoteredinibacter isoporae]|uniref:replication endonuclease n=1 Tax=Pseudoteredinibacter isoporae TaxID=570281 RepID=UPI00310A716D
MHPVAVCENERFRDKIVGKHRGFSSILRGAYEYTKRQRGIRAANVQLREIDEQLQAEGLPFPATMDLDEVRMMADGCAQSCTGIKNAKFVSQSEGRIAVIGSQRPASFEDTLTEIITYIESFGLSWPVKITRNDTAETIQKKNESAIARVCCAKWWRRKLKTRYSRQVESVAIQLGCVRQGKSPYVSDWYFERWKGQQRKNRALIESMEMEEATTGEMVPMEAAVDASPSNPEIRRDELMVRIRGFEEIADAMELRGLFLTLTCPSKYHAWKKSGQPNPKYQGYTPKQASDYLCQVWARIRADWNRKGIRCFGFRVCEPHHDGTPHWHLMLFFCRNDLESAKRIFSDYALHEDGFELGAKEYRSEIVEIDPAKGTAAGYIAKYISKNIDAHGVDADFEGGVTGEEGAARVRAWASLWGIRQFQQIGCASVTVWRELRRRREPLEEWEPEEAEAIREAADDGDWAKFVELMGGAFSGRDDQKLRALYIEKPEPNTYQEEVKRIIGLVMRGAGRMIRTRFKVWIVHHNVGAGANYEAGEKRAAAPPVLDLCQ